ncbi:MAG: multidrug efflux pump subunit AcrB [Flavobacteriales bacterium]|jgi:multidrug efflux pump subunit AcrB
MSNSEFNTHKGIIAWFARNPVAANLLMIAIVILGVVASLNIRKQMFPLPENTWLDVSVVYRGASPQEIEESITIKIEEAIESVQGIERVLTFSNRGNSTARVKVLEGYDAQEVLDELKSTIDAIPSFPEGIERPLVKHNKFRQEVMYISLAADMPLKDLKVLGEQIHDELRAIPEVNISDYFSGPRYEIAIEVSQDKLREYKLSFNDIAGAVRSFSTNTSAGEVRSDQGFISVRVEQQAYTGADFESIPLRTLPDGSILRLSDIAVVNDGFEEGVQYSKLDGVNSVTFFIGASKDQSITDISEVVHQYIEDRQKTLPEEVRLEPWVDLTYYLNGRLDMMLENMLMGAVLVFLILSVFLRIKLAFWVMVGLPVAFLGALAMLPLGFVGVTINIASLFAFIMVLGVVVDDAIIIGESVHTEVEDYGSSLDNVIRGVQRVAVPATFGVLTTIAAFLPMILDNGPNSAFPNSIGYVVAFCLIFSLIESKLILPAHLASLKPEKKNSTNVISRFRGSVDTKLRGFIQGRYTNFLRLSIHYRYTVFAVFTGIVFITVGLVKSDNVRIIGFPKVPHDFITANIEMKANASEESLKETMLAVDAMIRKVEEDIIAEFGAPMVDKVNMYDQGRTRAQLQAKLVDPEFRPMDTFALSARWQEAMPKNGNLKSVQLIDQIFDAGSNDGDVSFKLSSTNEKQLKAATAAIRAELAQLKGVYGVNDSEQQSAKEVQFSLKPVATSMGLTTSDVAAQASFSLYGVEAQRIVRDKSEIRVMVRYPKNERNAIGSVEDVLIRTPLGAEIPLSDVAELEFKEGVNQIYREDGRRAVTIWASVDAEQTDALSVANQMRENFFSEVKERYPNVEIEEAGQLKNQRADLVTMVVNTGLILLFIYVLLALPLRSYAQPLIIMSIIPFGIIGAIFGHIIMGYDVSSMSLFGMYAVVGVVVNDSLVMVDYVNGARKRGESIVDAVVHAGQKRFRAILLTSLTTFCGLVPIMFESSLQAQIVIPMAVSLAFGVLFATVVTLVLVPCLYVIMSDFKRKKRNYKPVEDNGLEDSSVDDIDVELNIDGPVLDVK